ncbi:hypothetical protein LJC27_02185 [Christensenellaceae bacterium OttesenSCG-928-M15]|nr:hypothetical protein [Christensenellaceae bacterium OttesenSCG-928-M15]
MERFDFVPASFAPFQDNAVLDRLRRMDAQEIAVHKNENFRLHVGLNICMVELMDLFARIKESDDKNKKFVFICGNPNPGTYLPLVEAINYHRVNCRNVFPFTMDEWADDQDNIAPITYRSGFTYSFLKYFYERIDPSLRMPLTNIGYPTTENIAHYSDMIDEAGGGGADVIYSGPGWAGHIAFIDPCKELINGFEERGTYEIRDLSDPYFEQKAQVLTLHPLTIMQNSLHGVFGCSGDIANVPPKAATIGPRDVLHAKIRQEYHGLATMGTNSSWQRMTSRMITHGPVTPYVPGSVYQLMDCDVFIDETIAKPIACMETAGY